MECTISLLLPSVNLTLASVGLMSDFFLIFAVEKSRVRLSTRQQEMSDYINASYISVRMSNVSIWTVLISKIQNKFQDIDIKVRIKFFLK